MNDKLQYVKYILNDLSLVTIDAPPILDGEKQKRWIVENAPPNAVYYRYKLYSTWGFGRIYRLSNHMEVFNRFVNAFFLGNNYVKPIRKGEIPREINREVALAVLAMMAMGR